MSSQQPPPHRNTRPSSGRVGSSPQSSRRPPPIIRNASSSTTSEDRTNNAYTQRPSLLAGLSLQDSSTGTNTVAPPRPRALWKVVDTSLRSIPPFYPPLDPRCTVYISDAPPSVVAVRITECLRKRSISVEYDEEAVTATCMTVDRCRFVISMYRGKRGSTDDHTRPDFSHGVIVECVRVRGPVMSFHQACRAILSSASGYSSGQDVRKPFQTSPWEFPRLLEEDSRPSKKPRTTTTTNRPFSVALALTALEHSLSLLKKDRIGPQKLGMDCLVALTDVTSSGYEMALHCSLVVLGGPTNRNEPASITETSSCPQEIHDWIITLLQDRKLPGEVLEQETPMEQGTMSSGAASSQDHSKSTPGVNALEDKEGSTVDDEQHVGVMRSLALRAFTNALSLLGAENSALLRSIISTYSPYLIRSPLLSALLEDLAGANRPPTVVQGTRLASAHEAALAIRALRVLKEHAPSTSQIDKLLLSENVLESLEQARAMGRATHDVLAHEADLTYTLLTEDVRSC